MSGKQTYTSSKATATVRLSLRALRKLIETDPDPVVQRIAQAMESAIRWSTEKTVRWQPPAVEARIMADILRDDLKRRDAAGERKP